METIKNYLESMFSSLPDSMEVRKAKEELYQMMEDKYYELKREGKSENEVVGVVITEFGNLDELREELGLNHIEAFDDLDKAQKYVSVNEAREYISTVKKYSNVKAAATMLCIFSPIFLIFLSGITEVSSFRENIASFVGLVALFLLIIIAVVIFVYTGNQMEEFEYMKKEKITVDKSTEDYIRFERKQGKTEYSIKMIIGIVMCIISAMPLLFAGLFLNDFACIISVCILLFMVGIGVAFIVSSSMVQDSYKILLQEGEFSVNNKGKNLDIVATVYWCIITAVYLGWSFWTFKWGITWIIWPVAGVLYGAVAAISSGIMGKGK